MASSADFDGRVPATIEKVTAFVTRRSTGAQELLLFRHPYSGVQIPAGTVEAGEPHAAAALREAREETGLSDLKIVRYLGQRDASPLPGHVIISERTTVYARPNTLSFDWAKLPRGAMVRVERAAEGYTQVTFEESDRWPDTSYATYRITGWVPNSVLAARQTRHFYQLVCHHATEDTWEVDIDYHRFRLFWAPLDELPEIVAPQVEWLDMLWQDG